MWTNPVPWLLVDEGLMMRTNPVPWLIVDEG